jgi:prepilin-type N-terminal cleavage/methylation domain-containing protein
MKKQAGYSLIEIMVVLGIISASSLVLISVIHYINLMLYRNQTKWALARVTTSIEQIAGLPSTIRSSINPNNPENQLANECFFGVKDCPNASEFDPFVPVRLYLPFIEKLGGYDFKPGGAITGTSKYPIRFNAQGQLCDTFTDPNKCPAAQWPIECITEANFTCPPVFSRDLDESLRGGARYFGPLFPDAIKPDPSNFCKVPGEIRIHLIIQESVDPGGTKLGLFKPVDEFFKVPYGKVKERVPFED